MFIDDSLRTDEEVIRAQYCLGLIKLHGGKSNSLIKKNILREYRKILKETELPSDILQYRVYDDGFTFEETFLLNCNDDSDVIKFIKKNQLSLEYHEAPCTIYDCSSAMFGGKPIFRKVCTNRYLLKYYWSLDV